MNTEYLLNERTVEKMGLAKQLGTILQASDIGRTDPRAEEAAALLAADSSRHVREVLAHALRLCASVPNGLIETIATDEETVAGGFLVETPAMAEADWLKLIPKLKDANLSFVARRSDVSDAMQCMLARIGGKRSVTTLVRNDAIQISEDTCDLVMSRFSEDIRIMDQLSARADLTPDTVRTLMEKVSSGAYQALLSQYSINPAAEKARLDRANAVWTEIAGATTDKVEKAVIRLERGGQLTDDLIVSIGERGGKGFFEIALSHRAALPLQRVREMLSLQRSTQFVQLIRMARITDAFGPRFLAVAKRDFSIPADQTISEKRAPRAADFTHSAAFY